MMRTAFLGLTAGVTMLGLCASAWGHPVQGAPAPLLAAGIPAFAAVGAAAIGARFFRRGREITKK